MSDARAQRQLVAVGPEAGDHAHGAGLGTYGYELALRGIVARLRAAERPMP